MTDKEILNELVREKKIEKTAAAQAASFYSTRTKGQELNYERQVLKKRLREIEAEENPPIPYLEEIKKQQLHIAVMKHKSEQKKINQAVMRMFEQNDLTRSSSRAV